MRLSLAITSLCLAALTAIGCTRTETVDLPTPPKANSIIIEGKTYQTERLLYEENEIVYPPDEAKEEGASLRIMAAGAVISADIPLRLAGSRIDLASRNRIPSPGNGIYYTFHVSVRGENGLYCSIVSWGSKNEDEEGIPYGGWFSVSRGEGSEEWIFEWELTDLADGSTVSTGYVKSVFENINAN